MINANADLVVMSDGSGFKDGYGGWAVIVFTPDMVYRLFRMGNASGTSTDRMEFTAALEGLHLAWQIIVDVLPERKHKKPVIQWLSDRENIVLSARNACARSNCPDLWRRYEYFEERMDIRPQHVPREVEDKLSDFKMVDLQSSVGREMLKTYLNHMELPEGFTQEMHL